MTYASSSNSESQCHLYSEQPEGNHFQQPTVKWNPLDNSEPFIRLIDVSKIFYSQDSPIVALKRTNLEFHKGEFVSLLGPSGSGKTTLLSLVAGIIRPTKGKIIIEGKDVSSFSEDEWAILRRTHVGFVFQSHNLIGPLTAYDNVEIPLLIAGMNRRERGQRVISAMKLTETYDLRERGAQDLSGGEQQRIAIARAIVTSPSIILADEPTGDLDSETGSRVMEGLRAISQERGATVIAATHDQMLVSSSNRILRIRDGWISGDGEYAAQTDAASTPSA